MFSHMLPTVALSLVLVIFNVQGKGIQLPAPKGPLNIGTTTFELTDPSRLDPFASSPENRSVQLSLHYPISGAGKFPFSTYLPLLTAETTAGGLGLPPGILQNISTHAHDNAPILDSGKNVPVILFSPGLGASRLVYTTFVQDLASQGYVVVSIDHPRDASIVEMSDGRVITANVSGSLESIDLDITVRAADARFVLDELATGDNFKVPGLNKGLDTSRVGFFGHSLGGATAATTMVLDTRVVAGVNMDGSFFGPDVLRGFSRPFMIMASEGHNRTDDPSWAAVWANLTGFKREIEVQGAKHLTYSDGPVVGNLLDLTLPPAIFGTIVAQRFDKIQHAYLTAFFDFSLKGRKEKLLDGPTKQFPEVSFHD